MQPIDRYKNPKMIYDGSRSRIYRANDENDDQQVLLKIFTQENPASEDTAGFSMEYDILSRFDDDGIIEACRMFEFNTAPVIVLKDIGGTPLADIFHTRKITIDLFLRLSIRITEIIGKIHEKNIIHKDINPSNIIWNMETDQVQIIDFGISTELPREITPPKNPRTLEGTLAYISPEQTGRMNHPVDYRTDFYSLGATFYRLLTGQLPFETKNHQSLIHHHLAVLPIPPHHINAAIPEVVSDIVMKLLAKSPEDRYLSAHGLKADLKLCQESLLNNRHIEAFELGFQDISDKFQIPQKLYGRNHEVALLMSAFERVRTANTELLMISGFSGIGKSALINEIHKPIVKHGGYFISGKFERLKKDIPYSGFIQVFSSLAGQILTEDDATLRIWRDKISAALGTNGKIITDMIPRFELILGKQPEIAALEQVETQNRFNLVLQAFLKAVAGSDHPLVLFLDDLQWADPASLHLLHLFSTDSDIRHLMMIGAYRHNETPETHPLTLTLADIRKKGTTLHSLFLKPLNRVHIQELLNDALHHPKDDTAPLADLLLKKTDGNPFFINEFLKALYKKNLIRFSFEQGWSWDMAGIEALPAIDQGVHFMAQKIADMPENSQHLLKTGACIGSYFTMKTLATICKKSEKEIKPAMFDILKEGFLDRIEDIYSFSHDRIMEAAYSLLSAEEKVRLHYRIGMLELARTDKNTLPDRVFSIANHLNAGKQLITGASEKRTAAEMNLMAGKIALAANAYNSALRYLTMGIDFLEKNAWYADYALTLSLYQEAATAAQLTANYDQMEDLAEMVLHHGKTILDKIKVYQAKILAGMAKHQPLEGMRIGLTLLRQLGVKIPEKPGPVRILFQLILTKLTLAGKAVENLINLPEMTDPHKLVIMQILSIITPAAYTAVPEMVPLVNFNGIRLTVKYGRNIYSPYFYAIFGLIHCGFLNDINGGYAWGQLSRKTIEKFNNKIVKSRSLMCIGCFINHKKMPLRDIAHELFDAYSAGMETGDLEFAALSLHLYALERYIYGENLAVMDRDMYIYKETLGKLKQETAMGYHEMLHQFILNLRGKSDDPCILVGTAYNADKMIPKLKEANDGSAVTGVYQALCAINYMFEKFEKAFEYAELMQDNIESVTASPIETACFFYDALARLAVFSRENRSNRKKIMHKVKQNRKKIKKWADHAPMNYKHKYHLVEAEIARIRKRTTDAEQHYKLAVTLADESRYINEKALSLELYAKFQISLNREDKAAVLMQEACKAYYIWGATAKVRHLEEKYSHLLRESHMDLP